jgi:hypothetical protein
MDTLLVAQDDWDLVLDASGNIAVASNPYSISQDVASAIKTFLSEVYYDTSQGIPYFQSILGQRPPLRLIKSQIEKAALTVPETVSARCLFAAFSNRKLTGQVQVIDQDSQTHNINF